MFSIKNITIFFLVHLFLFLQIYAQLEPPNFSHKRGFYNNPFYLTITAPKKNFIIAYTLDCSDPRTSSSVLFSESDSLTILIDPSITENRFRAPGFIVRASSVNNDTIGEPITHTYLFPQKVVELSPEGIKPGPNWPEPTRAANPQVIDYGLASDIIKSSKYKDLVDDALLAIPTISIATDLSNLFDLKTGIYMNAMMDGIDWERPASIELINPNGSKGFQINAGIRIRGGWSRHGDNPKHAFRLFFRNEYGKGKLEYPLFENEGVTEFDKIDLRTSQNYSWSYPGHLSQYNTMNRDVFSRDLQRETNQPYTRSRYYHLYINGVYWGLYQTQERAEASFAQSYLGGREEDYDVIKVGDN